MIIQTFDCSGGEPKPLQYCHYTTEKERKRLIEQAHADAKQGSGDVWVSDITNLGIVSKRIEEIS